MWLPAGDVGLSNGSDHGSAGTEESAMSYYGTAEELVALLREAQRAVVESPAGHWRGSAVRSAASSLAQSMGERIYNVDPEPEPPRTAPSIVR